MDFLGETTTLSASYLEAPPQESSREVVPSSAQMKRSRLAHLAHQ